MKLVAIGDIHGRDSWKQIIENELGADREVFIGDYFDTWAKLTPEEQVENFKAIIAYKRANPERVVVLMGNHDYHYISGGRQYSGYQTHGARLISEAVADALSDSSIQMCHIEQIEGVNYLFTHAGVTKTWAAVFGIDENNPDEEINMLFENDMEAFEYSELDNTGYGNHVSQSPIWVRPESLEQDMLPGFTQVVGHTTIEEMSFVDGLILIDTLGEGQYLIIEDKKLLVGQL